MAATMKVNPVTRVEYYRRLAGIDQGMLGERVGVSGNTVSRIERGARDLDDGMRDRIAEALGIDARLLDGEAGPTPPPDPGWGGSVSCRVRKLRKARGWSQAKLAARTGLDARRIAGIESGRAGASLEEALALAEALGCRVEDAFSRRERGPIKGTRSADAAAAMIGRRFGSLTVIDVVPVSSGGRAICRCDCGSTCGVRIDHLKSGHTTSCGCRRGRRQWVRDGPVPPIGDKRRFG